MTSPSNHSGVTPQECSDLRVATFLFGGDIEFARYDALLIEDDCDGDLVAILLKAVQEVSYVARDVLYVAKVSLIGGNELIPLARHARIRAMEPYIRTAFLAL